MKKDYLALLPLIVILICTNFSCNDPNNEEVYRTVNFDEDWRFIKGDPEDADEISFDDTGWRTLDLPHDWSIEDLPNQSDSVIGPFSKSSPGKMRTGYTVGGTAWYRKTFTIDENDGDKIAYLKFDGVYMNSDVWINGKHVGNHPYGYTSFYYDITSHLKPAGQPNVVAVQVKNEGENSRWYSGSGIYRHTWLTLVEPIHIGMWGVYVTTPSVSKKSAGISITSTIVNSVEENTLTKVQVQIIAPSGNVVGSSESDSEIPEQSEKVFEQNITINNPKLWTLDEPILYTVRVTVIKNNKPVDILDTKFGIRSIEFSAKKGFLLNGESVELVGGKGI